MEDIIIIGLCTLICSGEDFLDMGEFGKQREEWLKKFLELPNGIPDSDTFRRVFERIDPERLSECLYDWLGSKWEDGTVVAIDGKTICGSKNASHKELPCKITREKDHGRIEKREYRLLTDLSWLEERREWTGLKAIGMVKATITRNAKTRETLNKSQIQAMCYP